jgi:hypothetical protein
METGSEFFEKLQKAPRAASPWSLKPVCAPYSDIYEALKFNFSAEQMHLPNLFLSIKASFLVQFVPKNCYQYNCSKRSPWN